MSATIDPVLQKAIKGDRQALMEVLERAAPAARQVLRGAIPRRWQALLSADDVMQQTFTDAFLGIQRFVPRGEGSFSGWLVTLARRNLLDAIRQLEAQKRGGDVRQFKPRTAEESLAMLYEWVSGTGTSPSRVAAKGEAVDALKRSIQLLPPAYRQVITLYDLECRSIDEVSTAMERSSGAVYMLRARAHEQLREIMGGGGQYLTDLA